MLQITNNSLGIIIVLCSSLCFAVVPTVAKFALDLDTSLFALIFSRCLIGLFLLTPILILKKKSVVMPRTLIFPLIYLSLVSVALIATTYHAIEFLNIALVLVIMYSFPLGVALISHFRGEETVKFSQWLCLISILLGLTISLSDGTLQGNVYGITISVISLTFMIIFIYCSNKVVKYIGSLTFNFNMNFLSLLFLIIAYFLFDLTILIPESNSGKLALFLNGLFYVLSYTLFFTGSQYIGISRASVLAITEPLFASLFAFVFLSQILTLLEWFGFFVVIFSLYFYEKYKVPKSLN